MNSLAPGDRIGPYEVRAALGAGGMGEVYRAYDSALGREVAIKVLAGTLAGDRERLIRLAREARILASLNHPNIATIHGLEQSDSGPALVLELVEGQTLQDRLAPGALALVETLRFARQIADALEAAHEQGIVHRDLKPANIKIRPDGTVKVLDFGIAKILDVNEPAAPGAPTVTSTGEGVLIGTTYYMSPEQARGAEVTRRSDVWAFGAILFEMLTGKRAFSGSTRSDVLAAILQSSPDWRALPASTPSGIVRLVQRCLERDPKARLHDIGDARLEIEDEERVLLGEAPVHGKISSRQAAPRWRPWALGVAGVVTVAALAVAAYLVSTSRGREDVRQEVRLQMAPPPGTHFVSAPAVSLDGRQIVFVAAPDAGGPATMWLRPLSASAATQLPGTEGAIYPFWSANGRFVGFFADGQLKRVPVTGGNPLVVSGASAGRGGLWLDDDTIIFAPTSSSPLMRVSAAGGTPTPLTSLADDEASHRFPQRLPGRLLLYFSVNKAPERSGTRLISVDAPTREVNFIPTSVASEYVKGYLLFARGISSTVVAQPFSLPGGQLAGEPIEIGQARISETLGRLVMATAPTGVIATLGRTIGIGQLTWMSRDGRVLETVGTPETQLGVELSPDGRQVATFRAGDIWMINLARPVATRVTRGGANRHPIWSPDGARILSLFQGRGIATFDLVVTSVQTGDVETLRQNDINTGMIKPMGWTNNGRLIWTESVGGPASIWTRTAGGSPAVFLDDGARNLETRASPDGRWIAYSTDRSGRFEIEVRSLAEPRQAYPVSVNGGGYPRWRGDGREMYFLSPDGRLMAASFTAGMPPTVGKPSPLFEVKLIAHPDRGNFAAYEYDVTPDGSRFLVNRVVSEPETSMSIIVDWNPPR